MTTIHKTGEILCALTMFFPSYHSIKVIIATTSTETQLSIYDELIILQCLIHLPFSVALHVSRACGDPCYYGRGLIFRKLDYTFIYISSILLSYGLSNSLIYGTIVSCINVFFCINVWWNNNSKPPVNEIAICVFMYIMGLLINNRIMDFYTCVMIGFGAYICTFYDTLGYAMMHIMVGFLQYVFLSHLENRC